MIHRLIENANYATYFSYPLFMTFSVRGSYVNDVDFFIGECFVVVLRNIRK